MMEQRPKKSSSSKRGPQEERGPIGKAASSPAQEATRAQIASLEAQHRRLKATGRHDQRTAFQMRCLEEDMRKAHSKLRRLLNEAERQRRRRERLRGNSPQVPFEQAQDDVVMSVLKSCSHFQDLVRELNLMGFSVTPSEEVPDADESLPEVDGIQVQVELIEGDGEVETDKADNASSSSSSEIPSLLAVDEVDEDLEGRHRESYRRWFERQTEMQQRWEETFMREQMELARSLLDSATATFLQGVQQVVATLAAGGRRYPPFTPEPPPP